MRRRTFLTSTAILLCAPSLISDVQAQAPNPKIWSRNFQHLRKVYRRPGDFNTPVPTKSRSSDAQQLLQLQSLICAILPPKNERFQNLLLKKLK